MKDYEYKWLFHGVLGKTIPDCRAAMISEIRQKASEGFELVAVFPGSQWLYRKEVEENNASTPTS